MTNIFFALLCTNAFAESTIAGTIHSFDGSPVAQAYVYVFDARSRYEYTRSDGLGSFSIDVDQGAYRILIAPTPFDNLVPVFYPNEQRYCDGERIFGGDTIDVVLEEGRTISGTLESPTGEPIANALLETQDDVSPIDRVAQTDSNGHFLIQGLPTDHNLGWRCYIEAPGYPEQYIGATYEEDLALRMEDGDIGIHQLKEGIFLSGVVEGPQGPIPDAEVFGYSGSQVVGGNTQEDGTFFLQGLPPGDALVWSSAAGHATTYAPNFDRPTEFFSILEEGAIKSDFSVQLPEEQVLTISLVDDGPILGASVLLYNDNNTVGRGNPVDDAGVATIDRLHKGTYFLQIYAENDGYFNEWYEDEEGNIPIVIDENLDITIEREPASRLTGIILDDLGNTVYGADILMTNGIDVERAKSSKDGSYIVWGLYEDAWEFSVSYSALCPKDRSYVTMYYPNVPTASEMLIMEQSEHEHNVTLPVDDDHDEMADAWEEENGLNTTKNDAQEDPDQDGISNLEEYRNQSNPTQERDSQCGCQSNSASLVIPILLLAWRRRE